MNHVNEFGTRLEIKGSLWIITFKNGAGYQARSLEWSFISNKWMVYWQQICKSLFDKNKISLCKKVHGSAVQFYGWISNYEFESFDQFSAEHFSLFDEWLSTRPKLNQKHTPIPGTKLSEEYRRTIFNGLIKDLRNQLF
ncbi:hypothetical protein [Brevibacillus fortis]|uniref:hypothetical protein n=1 Tax=Brevibacillus fortis TaxID=2126352 RepID=UPI0038FC3304